MVRDDAHVLDMLRATRLALEFSAGMDVDGFLLDTKTQSAVLHQLTVLGEAAKRVSAAFRTEHPGIPWRQAAGVRDRIVHEYDSIDLDTVWAILQKELPALAAALEPIARREE